MKTVFTLQVKYGFYKKYIVILVRILNETAMPLLRKQHNYYQKPYENMKNTD